MSKFIQSLNVTTTENGAVTYRTTSQAVLDFFFSIGGMRHQAEEEIINKFLVVINQDPTLALKLLFYLRDARQGQGERRVFRVVLRWLKESHPEMITTDFVKWIGEYGRWDDLFELMPSEKDSVIIDVIRTELASGNALLAKWMPREKSGRKALAVSLRKQLGWTPKQYRKTLSNLTKVVEQQMCAGEWEQINFEQVPSVAALRYRKRFFKLTRYHHYLEDVRHGKAKMHADVLYPHNIIEQLMPDQYNRRFETLKIEATENEALELQWQALPNYLPKDSPVKMLPLVDVSGSMYTSSKPSAITVALSLGLYLSERNEGPFHNCFITFSNSPQLVTLTGESLISRLHQMSMADWGMNTNFEAVFDLILTRAMAVELDPSEMPTHLLVLSDMHFDSATREGHTIFESIQQKYALAGYPCPKIVFWNLNARGQNYPVQSHQSGAALVSGYSPSILGNILSQDLDELSPMQVMLDVLNSPRYQQIRLVA